MTPGYKPAAQVPLIGVPEPDLQTSRLQLEQCCPANRLLSPGVRGDGRYVCLTDVGVPEPAPPGDTPRRWHNPLYGYRYGPDEKGSPPAFDTPARAGEGGLNSPERIFLPVYSLQSSYTYS